MMTGLNFIYTEYGVDSIHFLFFSCIIVMCFIFTISIAFLLFLHLWLISKNLTTIEYMEKYKPTEGEDIPKEKKSQLSILKRFKMILGDNILLWFFPIDRNRDLEAYEFIDDNLNFK
jgi:hypothetical protein